MQKLNEEKRHNSERTSNFLVWIFISIVVFLSITRIIIANQLVGASEKLHTLDAKIQKLESDNQVLSEDLRQKESFKAVESKTQSLGFVPTSKYSFLKPNDPVAMNVQLNNF